ncbi:MAG: L-fucose/L-arabinose isomerase family protein [Nitrososphaeria archaeon]|nr:L-fucose/L-arabinose isomerase family protein [Nitrososphaeria archaeon]
MKLSPIGVAMIGDEREFLHAQLIPKCEEQLRKVVNILQKRLSEVYRYEKPEIIVGSKVITSIKTSKEVGEELSKSNAKVLIIIYYIWNYPYLVWPFINIVGKDKPILNLSNNEGRYPGNVGLLATDGALRQVGLKTHRIVGDIEDPMIQQKVVNWIMAAEAYASMKGQVYGMYGGHSMGMETGYFHMIPVQKVFGITTYQIDQLWLVEKMKEVSNDEVEGEFRWLNQMLGERIKYDGKLLTPDTLKKQIRLYLAMKKVNEEYGFDFCGIKGQREMTEYVCVTDVAEMLLNDPYDRNGPKEPFICATEADSFAAITMQILKYISGGLPVLFADVRLYHPDKDLWDFCNSGNHSSWYAMKSDDPRENFRKVTLHPALELYFKAGGASVEFDAAPGEMTFSRIGIWDDKLYMVIVTGMVQDLPEEERRRLAAMTDPTWPHVFVKLNCSFEEFISVFPCNHILGVAGNHVNKLVTYCEIAGIEPVVLGERREPPLWDRIHKHEK